MVRVTKVFLILFPGLLVFSRIPGLFRNLQFYAEDGSVFFRDAWELGFLRSLMEPYAGYLHVLPRLAAGSALVAPLEYAPLVLNLIALSVNLAPCWYLVSSRMEEAIPSFSGRVLCAALFAVAPASASMLANITNAQWYLALAACMICASTPAINAKQGLTDGIVMGLCSLSFPLSAIFLPFAIRRFLQVRRRGGNAWPFVVPAVLCIGVALQIAVVLAGTRVTRSFLPSYSAFSLIRELVMFGFFNAVLGMAGNMKYYSFFSAGIYLAGLAVLIFLAVAAWKRRFRLPLILLFASMAIFVFRHAFPLPNQPIPDRPSGDLRYSLFFVLFTLVTALHLVLQGGRARYVGAAIIVPAMIVGIPRDYSYSSFHDTHYADQVAVFRTLPKGAPFSFPVIPKDFLMMVLTSKGGIPSPSPLEGLRRLSESTFSLLHKVSVGGHQRFGFANVGGLAIDRIADKVSGGVFIVVDGRLYPAVTGLDYKGNPLPSLYAGAGFTRSIPLEDIGPGRHEISLIVLTHDRKSFFRPTETTTFTTD